MDEVARVVCPACGQLREHRSGTVFTCRQCGLRREVDESHSLRSRYFETLYQEEREPWEYTRRAAEALRHDFIVRLVEKLLPNGGRIADLGCSLGQLTCRLRAPSRSVHGFDLSYSAAREARTRCVSTPTAAAPPDTAFSFCTGSVLDLPIRRNTFDLLLLCDGLYSWRLTREEQVRALREASAAAVPGGYLILTDYIGHPRFDDFLGLVREADLEVVDQYLLGDRLWYSLERALRGHHQRLWARRVLASRNLGRALSGLSQLAGRRGSKHLCIVARRQLAAPPS